MIISEWGGFGLPNYGRPKNDVERADQIDQFKKELRSRPVAGDVYTQATNIEEEQNSLIDSASGRLKVPKNLLDPSRHAGTDPQLNNQVV